MPKKKGNRTIYLPFGSKWKYYLRILKPVKLAIYLKHLYHSGFLLQLLTTFSKRGDTHLRNQIAHRSCMRARKSGLETTTETSQTILWGCFKKTQLWPVNSGALWHHPPHKLRIYSALASSHGSILDCSLADWTLGRAVSYACRAWGSSVVWFLHWGSWMPRTWILQTYKGHFIGTIGKPESMTYLLP